MNRKEFLHTCGCAALGALAVGSLTTGCANTMYIAKHSRVGKVVVIPLSEFVDVTSTQFQQLPFVIINVQEQKYPIAVYAHPDQTYSALLLRCTHRNCELQPQNEFLQCPCHGSEFTSRGVVQSPPALVNLESFLVTKQNNNVEVHL